METCEYLFVEEATDLSSMYLEQNYFIAWRGFVVNLPSAKDNTFHRRCLRKIHRILHSYLRHITDEEVLYHAWSKPLEDILLCRQLIFFGDIIYSSNSNILRSAFFLQKLIPPSAIREENEAEADQD